MSKLSEIERKTIERLLYALDLPSTVYVGPERRKEPRLKYRRKTSIRLMQANGEVVVDSMVTRNLSAQGIACLHHKFAYPESNVVVSLSGRDGSAIHIAGRVLNCRYVGHGFHSTSILFHERIDLENFLLQAEFGSAGTHLDQIRTRHDATESVRAKLEGLNLVLIDSEESGHKNLKFLLQSAGANVLVVPYLGSALDLLRTTRVDLLLCGPAHDGADALQIIDLCRSLGFRHPIIGLGWDEATAQSARAAPRGEPLDFIDSGDAGQIMEMIDRYGPDIRDSRRA